MILDVGSISHNFANQTLFKVAFNTQTPKELRVPKQTLKAQVQTFHKLRYTYTQLAVEFFLDMIIYVLSFGS